MVKKKKKKKLKLKILLVQILLLFSNLPPSSLLGLDWTCHGHFEHWAGFGIGPGPNFKKRRFQH